MKEELKELVKNLFNRKEFIDGKFSLTLNYDDVIRGYRQKNVSKETLYEALNLIESNDITSFNVTMRIERGTEDYNYKPNWKSVGFIFYGKNGEKPNFEFDTLGSRESFRISDKLRKQILDDDGEVIGLEQETSFEFSNMNSVIEQMIQLDVLLDKHEEEKQLIYTRLKLWANS